MSARRSCASRGDLVSRALIAQDVPLDVWPKILATNGLSARPRLALDGRASFRRNLPIPSQPFADRWLLDPQRTRHGSLAAEALDRSLDCVHGQQYRHCRCPSQAHCLSKAVPVAIPSMLTGPQLGAALKAAMEKKGVTQDVVAEAFGVRQPSVSEWVKFGRIGKKHITKLVEWFSDVVGPEHWGLPPSWGTSYAEPGILRRLSGRDRTTPPPAPDFTERTVSDSDWGTLQDVRLVLTEEEIGKIRARATELRTHVDRLVEERLAASKPESTKGGKKPRK